MFLEIRMLTEELEHDTVHGQEVEPVARVALLKLRFRPAVLLQPFLVLARNFVPKARVVPAEVMISMAVGIQKPNDFWWHAGICRSGETQTGGALRSGTAYFERLKTAALC